MSSALTLVDHVYHTYLEGEGGDGVTFVAGRVDTALEVLAGNGAFRSGQSRDVQKWNGFLEKLCRHAHVHAREVGIQALERTIIELERVHSSFETGSRYCDWLVHLLRQGEHVAVRAKAAVVFARLAATLCVTDTIEVRKAGVQYAVQALPLCIHLIESVTGDDITAGLMTVAGLEGVRGVLAAYPTCVRNPPRKLAKTINNLLDDPSEPVQQKAAEAFAALTFAKSTSRTGGERGGSSEPAWENMFSTVLSNIINILVRHSGADKLSAKSRFKEVLDAHSKINILPLEGGQGGELSATFVPRRMRGLCYCLVELLAISPLSQRKGAAPSTMPTGWALFVLDQMVLTCMTGVDQSTTQSGEHNQASIHVLLFHSIARVFVALFDALGTQVLKVYSACASLIVSVLRWTNERKLPSLRLDFFNVARAFLHAVGPALTQSLAESLATVCLHEFAMFNGTSQQIEVVSTNQHQRKGQKRQREEYEANVWTNAMTLFLERLVTCVDILSELVRSSGPRMGSSVRGKIHDLCYLSMMPGGWTPTNHAVAKEVNLSKAFHRLLLASAMSPCASTLPSLYNFAIGLFASGARQLDDADGMRRYCQDATMALQGLLQPTARPFTTYINVVEPLRLARVKHGEEEEEVENADMEMDDRQTSNAAIQTEQGPDYEYLYERLQHNFNKFKDTAEKERKRLMATASDTGAPSPIPVTDHTPSTSTTDTVPASSLPNTEMDTTNDVDSNGDEEDDAGEEDFPDIL
jgi:hypothetical protein